MEEKYNVIRCEKGDIIRINGLSNTVKVKAMALDSSGKVVQVLQND